MLQWSKERAKNKLFWTLMHQVVEADISTTERNAIDFTPTQVDTMNNCCGVCSFCGCRWERVDSADSVVTHVDSVVPLWLMSAQWISLRLTSTHGYRCDV